MIEKLELSPLLRSEGSTWSSIANSAYDMAGTVIKGVRTGIEEHPTECAVTAATVLGLVALGRTAGVRSLFRGGSPSTLHLAETPARLAIVNETASAALQRSSITAVKPFRSELFGIEPSLVKMLDSRRFLSTQERTVANLALDRSSGVVLGKFRGGATGGIHVGQAMYGIASLEQPLATSGLSTCGALVVKSEQQGLHYLAHLDSAVTSREISRSLQIFDLSKSEIFFLKGPVASPVENTVICALRKSPQALSQLKFVTGLTETFAPKVGLISHRAGLYQLTPAVKTWSKFELPQPKNADLVLFGLRAS